MTEGFTLTARDATGARSVSVDLQPGVRLKIGRLADSGLAIVWDREVSREHAWAELDGSFLRVGCLESGRNPIVHAGQPTRECRIANGEQFQIGQTQFRYEGPDEHISVPPPEETSDVEEHSYAALSAAKFNFENMAKQMVLLCDLPDMISKAQSDVALGEMLCGLLLNAIPQAVAVAVAQYNDQDVEYLKGQQFQITQVVKPQMMRVQTRDSYEGRFSPSRRLVGRALAGNAATVHIWSGAGGSGHFTMAESLDWAFCVPIVGESTYGWCLYVSGEGGKNGSPVISKEELEPEIRFTQLLSQFISSVRSVRLLQEQKTQLSSFFSPKVIETLTGGGDVLSPSERDITVLFCDVRGFSRKAERYKDDLLHLLNCVREALNCMTGGILKFDGAIADFQGDAALGFWGWPVPLAEGAMPACLAALAVQDEFLHPERHDGKLDGFTVGIGVAHGRAIAGQIGTAQQAKIGVFGPVVNQGSRLEGMTKQFGVSICMDEQAAEFCRKFMKKEQGRVRRLARVRPKGMDTAMTVSQLLPPSSDGSKEGPSSAAGVATVASIIRQSMAENLNAVDANSVSDDHIEDYETILDLVIAGTWDQALTLLRTFPDEGPKDFLLAQMAKHNNKPPANWDGAFSLSEK